MDRHLCLLLCMIRTNSTLYFLGFVMDYSGFHRMIIKVAQKILIESLIPLIPNTYSGSKHCKFNYLLLDTHNIDTTTILLSFRNMSAAQHLPYGEIQEQGALCHAWITNPKIPCPIVLSQLTTVADLDADVWDVNTHPNGLPHSYTSAHMQDLDIPNQQYHLTTAHM